MTDVPKNDVPGASAPSHRLDYIDGLRCYACLWVILVHSVNANKITGHPNALLAAAYGYVGLGYLGVHLFLVLSGFCLYFPIVRRYGVADSVVNVKEFAVRRARRILPPYYIALVLSILWNVIPGLLSTDTTPARAIGLKDVVLHVLMLHNLTANTFYSINDAFWSLALESQLYLIFPLLVLLARRFSLWSMLAAPMFISLVWQLFSLWWIGRHGGTKEFVEAHQRVLFYALPARCFEFAAGMCAAALVAKPRPAYVGVSLALAAVVAVPDLWWLSHYDRYGVFIDQGFGIVFASILVAASFIPAASFQSGILAGMTWVGMFSYSLYLIHLPLLNLLRPSRFGLHLAGVKLIAFDLGRLVPVILLAYGFFLVAEKPFLTRKETSEHRRP